MALSPGIAQGQTLAASDVPHTAITMTFSQPAHRAADTVWYHTVAPGDTLSILAGRYYGNSALWPALWWVNKAKIPDPDDVPVGLVIKIDPWHPDYRWLTEAAVRAIPAPAAESAPRPAVIVAAARTQAAPQASGGTLSCAGLERLWESAGGSSGEAFMAAEVAMAESGGRQYALSPTNDYGYWQINGSHGPAEATFNPYGNARAAVLISGDGTNWSPWTTWRDGLEAGRC